MIMANTNQKLRMLLEAERAKSAALQATLEKQANDYALLQKKLRKASARGIKLTVVIE